MTQIKALTGHVVLVAPTQAEAFMRALSLLFWRYVRFSTKRLSGQVNMTSALDNRIITDMAIVIGRSKVMSRQRILDAILDTSGFQKKRPCASPGVVESELADTISDQTARERMKAYRKMAIQPDAFGRAIQDAIEQPNDVDVNEIVVRPLATLV